MFFCSLKYFLSWSVPSLRLQLPGSPGLLHKLLPEFRGLFLLQAFFLATRCLPFEKVAEVMSASVTLILFCNIFFFCRSFHYLGPLGNLLGICLGQALKCSPIPCDFFTKDNGSAGKVASITAPSYGADNTEMRRRCPCMEGPSQASSFLIERPTCYVGWLTSCLNVHNLTLN